MRGDPIGRIGCSRPGDNLKQLSSLVLICAHKKAAHEREQPKTGGETIKVRIAVAVNPAGHWSSFGCCVPLGRKLCDEEVKRRAGGPFIREGYAAYLIEADVPAYSVPTVQGRVAAPGTEESLRRQTKNDPDGYEPGAGGRCHRISWPRHSSCGASGSAGPDRTTARK